MPELSKRWYPSQEQLKDPVQTERVFRETLRQLYDLQDKHEALKAQVASPSANAAPTPQGPSNTKLLGLHVFPVDTSTLADGATLKFSKSGGYFFFG